MCGGGSKRGRYSDPFVKFLKNPHAILTKVASWPVSVTFEGQSASCEDTLAGLRGRRYKNEALCVMNGGIFGIRS